MMMRSVIEIAREAGLGYFRILDSDNTSVDALERFANLVVEATKENVYQAIRAVETPYTQLTLGQQKMIKEVLK